MSAEIAGPIGYRALIRTNRDFRYLWFGQIVSNLGDWFSLIASASLVAILTESGLAVGPLLLRPFTQDRLRQSAWAITIGYLVGGLGLALTAPLASYGLALVGTLLRGAGNGIVWIFSTQLLLQLVPTEVRGRVVSTEFAFSMLISAMGAAAVGAALDFPLTISTVAWVMALLTLIPATLWSLYLIFNHEWFALPDPA